MFRSAPPTVGGISLDVRRKEFMNRDSDLISYALRELSPRQIKEFAGQYEGIDMIELMFDGNQIHPFLMRIDDDYVTQAWDEVRGPTHLWDEDSVRAYATVEFLKRNGFPKFENYQDAVSWAAQNGWPTDSVPPPVHPASNIARAQVQE